MSLREYLQKLEDTGVLRRISAPVSRHCEIAGVLKKLEPQPLIFENVRESGFQVAGNLFCSKAAFADYFGVPVSQIIPLMRQAIERPAPTG